MTKAEKERMKQMEQQVKFLMEAIDLDAQSWRKEKEGFQATINGLIGNAKEQECEIASLRSEKTETLNRMAEAVRDALHWKNEKEEAETRAKEEIQRFKESMTFEARESKALSEMVLKNEQLQDKIGWLECQLERAHKDVQQTVERDHTAPAKRKIWHYIFEDCVMPEEGQDCMCLCINLRDFADRLSRRLNHGGIETQITCAKYIGKKHFRFSDIPFGHVVVAWQILPKHSTEKVVNFALESLMYYKNEPEQFGKIMTDPTRARLNPEGEKKYLWQLLKGLQSAIDQRNKREDQAVALKVRQMLKV